MDDARGYRLPDDARDHRRARAPQSGGFAPAALWIALPWLALPWLALPGRLESAVAGPNEYGWILGAGVSCLGAAWLLSRWGTPNVPSRRRRPRGTSARWRPERFTPPVTARDTRHSGVRWEDRLETRRVASRTATTSAPPAMPAPSMPPLAASAPASAAAPLAAAVPTPRHELARHSRASVAPSIVRPQRRHDRLGFSAPRRPSATTAWLHLVSGPNPAQTARGACTVAADLIERGGRVLLIDAGRRCMLNRRFGRDSRWGVGECLTRTLPLLGVVQETGFAGLHLLVRGTEPALVWEALGRLADDAHARYDHVIVALDPDVPREAGLAVVGRVVEGWWGGERLVDARARQVSERLGIAFSVMPMELESQVSLEALPGTAPVAGVEPAVADPASGVELPTVAALPPAALAETPAFAAGDAGAGLHPSPEDGILVIACDDDVRARLQFLKWVRGMAGVLPTSGPGWKLAGARA